MKSDECLAFHQASVKWFYQCVLMGGLNFPSSCQASLLKVSPTGMSRSSVALVDNQQTGHVQNAPLLLIILGTLIYKYVFVANVGCD